MKKKLSETVADAIAAARALPGTKPARTSDVDRRAAEAVTPIIREACAKVADHMQAVAAERLSEKHDDDAAVQHDTAMEIAATIRQIGIPE